MALMMGQALGLELVVASVSVLGEETETASAALLASVLEEAKEAESAELSASALEEKSVLVLAELSASVLGVTLALASV